MGIRDLEMGFNIDKIGKSPVKVDLQKVEYLNSMHIRSKFSYMDSIEQKKFTNSWRKMLIDTLPSHLHSSIKSVSESKMTRIMDLMKVRIHFY